MRYNASGGTVCIWLTKQSIHMYGKLWLHTVGATESHMSCILNKVGVFDWTIKPCYQECRRSRDSWARNIKMSWFGMASVGSFGWYRNVESFRLLQSQSTVTSCRQIMLLLRPVCLLQIELDGIYFSHTQDSIGSGYRISLVWYWKPVALRVLCPKTVPNRETIPTRISCWRNLQPCQA